MTFRLKPEGWEESSFCYPRKVNSSASPGLNPEITKGMKSFSFFLPFTATWVITGHIAQWSQIINTMPSSHQRKQSPTIYVNCSCMPTCVPSTQQTGSQTPQLLLSPLRKSVLRKQHGMPSGWTLLWPLSSLWTAGQTEKPLWNPCWGLRNCTDPSEPSLNILVKALEKHYLLPLKTLYSQFYQALTL